MSEERVKTHQFRQDLARLIAGVERRPVEIVTYRGEVRAYLISPTDYARLSGMLYNTVGNKAQ